jgi:hypothetical protein
MYNKSRTPKSTKSRINDLIIAYTSRYYDILVTNNSGTREAITQLMKTSNEVKCEVFNLNEFCTFIENTQ